MSNPYLDKLDDFVNRRLQRIFGLTPEGDRKVWLHSQCLNEDSRKLYAKGFREESIPLHGRLWLKWPQRSEFRLEWYLGSDRLGTSLGVSTAEGGEIAGNVAIPPVALYWGIETKWASRIADFIVEREREKAKRHNDHVSFDWEIFSIRWLDEAEGLFIEFWHDDNGWSSREAKWKRTTIHPKDILFGKQKHSETVLEEKDVLIPLPEGSYPAHVKLLEGKWSRPRWFPHIVRQFSVELETSIPFEGKGENSWDCGEDALYSMHGCGEKYEEAISAVVETVLRNRRRYNNNIMAKYPSPEVRKQRLAEEAKKRAEEAKKNPPEGVVSA